MKTTLALLGALAGTAMADVYMHNPRGSNDRNCERNVNRNNGNRMFDSQNNAKGGYACPRRVAGSNEADQTQVMYYAEGSVLAIEWTAQHGCGGADADGDGNADLDSKVDCEIVLQYACEDTLDPAPDANGALDVNVVAATRAADRPFKAGNVVAAPRDGVPQDRDDAATDTIPTNEADATPNTAATLRYGMHENSDMYETCSRVERNKGLFTADQNLNRNDARATRQNPNGNRNGLECPEERDYYPTWAPSPWIDVAVLTNNVGRCDYYTANSQNNVDNAVGFCKAATQALLEGTNSYQNRQWPNNQAACEGLAAAEGTTDIEWVEMPSKATWLGIDIPDVDCQPAAEARPNHLGNADGGGVANREGTGMVDASDNIPNNGEASRYLWTLPAHANDACVLRLRYNISTADYQAWPTEAAGDDATFLNAANNGDNSPIQQDPYVGISSTDENMFLSLALNTNQYGRTFQDRSYVFSIKSRDELGIAASANVFNLNTRGKRGNIVQTYPAVEYDFVPADLRVAEDDIIHFQWTGSDYNPRRGCNNGEGGPPDDNDQITAANANQNSRADRQNIVMMSSLAANMPAAATTLEATTAFGSVLSLSESDEHDDWDETTASSMQIMQRLAYLDQAEILADLGSECLTEDELDNINNNNERENHPRNCAKLNAQYHPYFDGGLVQMTGSQDIAYFSSRNNNFSNRDQTAYICVNDNLGNCAVPADNMGTEEVGDPNADNTGEILDDETVAFQEMDNDALGDGNADGCTELSWFPISGVTTEQAVGIAIVTLFVGMVFAVVCYKGYQRYRNPEADGKGSKFKSKDPKSWQRPKENEMI